MRAAFLVDGHTEQKFIQSICPSRPVQRINLNGSSVSAVAISKRVASQIRLWGGKYYPIVILVDLEDRPVSFLDFGQQIEAALREEGVVDDLIVGVADRMIENWILGDPLQIGWADCPALVDGLHGAYRLKAVLGAYDKAGDGPTLLAAARASEIRLRSSSFDDVCNKLRNVSCHWLTL